MKNMSKLRHCGYDAPSRLVDASSRLALAKWLDVAAREAAIYDLPPATGIQCWYLAGLMIKNGRDDLMAEYCKVYAYLSRRVASHLITKLNGKIR